MKCPSCGAENSALAQRCTDCGTVFPRPEDRTMENLDANTLHGADEKPKDSGNRPTSGGGTPGPIGGTSGGARPKSENWKDSQVISKTPSSFGYNDQFNRGDMEAGTLYGVDA